MALRERGIEPIAVIVSESEQQPVPLAETAAAIRRFVTPVAVAALPRLTAAAASHGSNAPTLLPLLAELLS